MRAGSLSSKFLRKAFETDMRINLSFKLRMVPRAGVEPARPLGTTDFKSACLAAGDDYESPRSHQQIKVKQHSAIQNRLRPPFHFVPLRPRCFLYSSPSAGSLCHESPSAQLSASLRVLHFIPPLRVCVRALTHGPMSLRGKHYFKTRALTVEGPPRC